MSENQKSRCLAVVYKRDTYRYTGRGRNGFEMHYTKCQCSFAARDGSNFCGKHSGKHIENQPTVNWQKFVKPRTRKAP